MERTAPLAHAGEDTICPGCGATADAAECPDCGARRRVRELTVRKVIARSAHGRLYLAETPDGRRVALKELVFALVPDVAQLDAFEREARILSAIDHPGVPRFLQSFREGEGVHTRLYLAQEFVDGESLLARVAREPLPLDTWLQIARELLEILAALHERTPQVLHRDLKPENVLLRLDGRVALVDFGAARHLQSSVTHGATLVGTFGYMAPEQLGGTVNARSDLYGLGATLVHLLTREPPANAIGADLALRLPRSLKVPGHVSSFLAKLCAPRPADRFASASEALAYLDRPWYRRPLGGRVLAGLGIAAAAALCAATFFPRTFDFAQHVADVALPAQHLSLGGNTVPLGIAVGTPYSPFDVQLVSVWRDLPDTGEQVHVIVRAQVKNHSPEPARADLATLLANVQLLDRDGNPVALGTAIRASPTLRPGQALDVDLAFTLSRPQMPVRLRARPDEAPLPLSL